MTVFMIERNFAEQLEITPEAAATINRINADVGVQWLISFLSADKKKTYCLYEASSAEAIREAAKRAGVPADVIINVGEISPAGLMGAVQKERFSAA
jgi:hypothetical protein